MGEARDTLNAEKRREQAVGPGVRVEWQGGEYTVHYGEVPATLELELRQQAGYSLTSLWRQVAEDPGFDTAGVLIWMARRIGGERPALRDVLEQIKSDPEQIRIREVAATAEPQDPVKQDGEAASPNA